MLGAAVIGFFVFLFVKDGLGPLLGGFTGSEFFGFTATTAGASGAWLAISVLTGGAVWVFFGDLSGRWSFGAILLVVCSSPMPSSARSNSVRTDGSRTSRIRSLPRGRHQAVHLHFQPDVPAPLLRPFHRAQARRRRLASSSSAARPRPVGLNLVSNVTTFTGALLALSVYAVGKTFFWPTMLAVTSDRFLAAVRSPFPSWAASE